MTGRTVKQWQGRTPDTPAPPRVRLRILLAHDRKDYRTGQPIRAGDTWELDHIIALSNGGANIESNLAPVLVENHKAKTAEDRRDKKRGDDAAKAHYGIHGRKRPLRSRGFPKQKKRGRIELPNTLPLPALARASLEKEG